MQQEQTCEWVEALRGVSLFLEILFQRRSLNGGFFFSLFLSAPSRKSVREFTSRRTRSSRQTRQTPRRRRQRVLQWCGPKTRRPS